MDFNKDTLKEAVEGGKPVVIDFWAEWCGPCRMVGPIIDQLTEEYGDVAVIGKVNVDDYSEIAAEYSVRNIPTIVFVKDGEVVDKIIGAKPKSEFQEKLKNIL